MTSEQGASSRFHKTKGALRFHFPRPPAIATKESLLSQAFLSSTPTKIGGKLLSAAPKMKRFGGAIRYENTEQARTATSLRPPPLMMGHAYWISVMRPEP